MGALSSCDINLVLVESRLILYPKHRSIWAAVRVKLVAPKVIGPRYMDSRVVVPGT